MNQVTNWIRSAKNVSYRAVSHHELLGDAAKVAGHVQRFLDLPLNTTAMADQVDAKLYRQRK
jgi:hypothetical protein